MSHRKHLLWFTLPDPHHPLAKYQVHLVMPSILGADNDAEIHFHRRRIHICAALDNERIALRFWHEALHLGRGINPVEEPYDEQFVRGAETGIMHIATSLGVSLPPFPRGFEQFRARAIAAQQGPK